MASAQKWEQGALVDRTEQEIVLKKWQEGSNISLIGPNVPREEFLQKLTPGNGLEDSQTGSGKDMSDKEFFSGNECDVGYIKDVFRSRKLLRRQRQVGVRRRKLNRTGPESQSLAFYPQRSWSSDTTSSSAEDTTPYKDRDQWQQLEVMKQSLSQFSLNQGDDFEPEDYKFLSPMISDISTSNSETSSLNQLEPKFHSATFWSSKVLGDEQFEPCSENIDEQLQKMPLRQSRTILPAPAYENGRHEQNQATMHPYKRRFKWGLEQTSEGSNLDYDNAPQVRDLFGRGMKFSDGSTSQHATPNTNKASSLQYLSRQREHHACLRRCHSLSDGVNSCYSPIGSTSWRNRKSQIFSDILSTSDWPSYKRGMQGRSTGSGTMEGYIESDEFMELPGILHGAETMANKLARLSGLLVCQPLARSKAEFSDSLVSLNSDQSESSGNSGYPSHETTPSLSDSLDSGPLSETSSQLTSQPCSLTAFHERSSESWVSGYTAEGRNFLETGDLVRELQRDITHQADHAVVWQKIETFVQKLDQLILWLSRAMETTDDWTPPQPGLCSLRPYMERHMSFKMNVDRHQKLKRVVLEEGNDLLRHLDTNKSGLGDTLELIENQWCQLQRQVAKQRHWLLRCLDKLCQQFPEAKTGIHRHVQKTQDDAKERRHSPLKVALPELSVHGGDKRARNCDSELRNLDSETEPVDLKDEIEFVTPVCEVEFFSPRAGWKSSDDEGDAELGVLENDVDVGSLEGCISSGSLEDQVKNVAESEDRESCMECGTEAQDLVCYTGPVNLEEGIKHVNSGCKMDHIDHGNDAMTKYEEDISDIQSLEAESETQREITARRSENKNTEFGTESMVIEPKAEDLDHSGSTNENGELETTEYDPEQVASLCSCPAYSDLRSWLNDMSLVVKETQAVRMGALEMESVHKSFQMEMRLWEPEKTRFIAGAMQVIKKRPELQPMLEHHVYSLSTDWDSLERQLSFGGAKPPTDTSEKPGMESWTMSSIARLRSQVAYLRTWLRDAELLLFTASLTRGQYMGTQNKEPDQVESYRTLSSQIAQRKHDVSKVLRMCTRVLRCELDDTLLDTELHALRLAAVNLSRRWEAVVMQMAQWRSRLVDMKTFRPDSELPDAKGVHANDPTWGQSALTEDTLQVESWSPSEEEEGHQCQVYSDDATNDKITDFNSAEICHLNQRQTNENVSLHKENITAGVHGKRSVGIEEGKLLAELEISRLNGSGPGEQDLNEVTHRHGRHNCLSSDSAGEVSKVVGSSEARTDKSVYSGCVHIWNSLDSHLPADNQTCACSKPKCRAGILSGGDKICGEGDFVREGALARKGARDLKGFTEYIAEACLRQDVLEEPEGTNPLCRVEGMNINGGLCLEPQTSTMDFKRLLGNNASNTSPAAAQENGRKSCTNVLALGEKNKHLSLSYFFRSDSQQNFLPRKSNKTVFQPLWSSTGVLNSQANHIAEQVDRPLSAPGNVCALDWPDLEFCTPVKGEAIGILPDDELTFGTQNSSILGSESPLIGGKAYEILKGFPQEGLCFPSLHGQMSSAGNEGNGLSGLKRSLNLTSAQPSSFLSCEEIKSANEVTTNETHSLLRPPFVPQCNTASIKESFKPIEPNWPISDKWPDGRNPSNGAPVPFKPHLIKELAKAHDMETLIFRENNTDHRHGTDTLCNTSKKQTVSTDIQNHRIIGSLTSTSNSSSSDNDINNPMMEQLTPPDFNEKTPSPVEQQHGSQQIGCQSNRSNNLDFRLKCNDSKRTAHLICKDCVSGSDEQNKDTLEKVNFPGSFKENLSSLPVLQDQPILASNGSSSMFEAINAETIPQHSGPVDQEKPIHLRNLAARGLERRYIQETLHGVLSGTSPARRLCKKVLEQYQQPLRLRKGDFYSYLSLSSHDSDCGAVASCEEDNLPILHPLKPPHFPKLSFHEAGGHTPISCSKLADSKELEEELQFDVWEEDDDATDQDENKFHVKSLISEATSSSIQETPGTNNDIERLCGKQKHLGLCSGSSLHVRQNKDIDQDRKSTTLQGCIDSAWFSNTGTHKFVSGVDGRNRMMRNIESSQNARENWHDTRGKFTCLNISDRFKVLGQPIIDEKRTMVDGTPYNPVVWFSKERPLDSWSTRCGPKITQDVRLLPMACKKRTDTSSAAGSSADTVLWGTTSQKQLSALLVSKESSQRSSQHTNCGACPDVRSHTFPVKRPSTSRMRRGESNMDPSHTRAGRVCVTGLRIWMVLLATFALSLLAWFLVAPKDCTHSRLHTPWLWMLSTGDGPPPI
uniref:uncharacterized protein n=1 Tax=Myxine glutinosa TaxID=7769 RepID=UPI00358F08CE